MRTEASLRGEAHARRELQRELRQAAHARRIPKPPVREMRMRLAERAGFGAVSRMRSASRRGGFVPEAAQDGGGHAGPRRPPRSALRPAPPAPLSLPPFSSLSRSPAAMEGPGAAAAAGAGPGGSNVSAFLTKLWTLVEDPETDPLICWSPVRRRGSGIRSVIRSVKRPHSSFVSGPCRSLGGIAVCRGPGRAGGVLGGMSALSHNDRMAGVEGSSGIMNPSVGPQNG